MANQLGYTTKPTCFRVTSDRVTMAFLGFLLLRIGGKEEPKIFPACLREGHFKKKGVTPVTCHQG